MIHGISSPITIPMNFWVFGQIIIVLCNEDDCTLKNTVYVLYIPEKTPLKDITFFKKKSSFPCYTRIYPSALIQRLFNWRVNSRFKWTLKCQNIFTRCIFLLKITPERSLSDYSIPTKPKMSNDDHFWTEDLRWSRKVISDKIVRCSQSWKIHMQNLWLLAPLLAACFLRASRCETNPRDAETNCDVYCPHLNKTAHVVTKCWARAELLGSSMPRARRLTSCICSLLVSLAPRRREGTRNRKTRCQSLNEPQHAVAPRLHRTSSYYCMYTNKHGFSYPQILWQCWTSYSHSCEF